MKKLIIIFAAAFMLLSCGVAARGQSIAEIIAAQEPELLTYYQEGVLEVTPALDGTLSYAFVEKRYYNSEDIRLIALNYCPDIYEYYVRGLITFSYAYKYVDEYGAIRYGIRYYDRRLRRQIVYVHHYPIYHRHAPLYRHRPHMAPPSHRHHVTPPPAHRGHHPSPSHSPNVGRRHSPSGQAPHSRPQGNIHRGTPQSRGGGHATPRGGGSHSGNRGGRR